MPWSQFQIKAISGTSVGADVAGFYCAGIPADKTLELFQEITLFRLLSFGRGRKGFMRLDGLKKLLQAHIPDQFDDLEIPLTVMATDINNDKSILLNQGNLHDAIIASCSIPITFKPVILDGKECVDGGLLNNMPANVLKGKVDKVIGVHINNYSKSERSGSIQGLADKVFSLVIRQNVMKYKEYSDYFINPKLKHVGVFDFGHLHEFFETGQEIGKQFLADPQVFELGKKP